MRFEIGVDGMDTVSEILDGIQEQIIPLAAIGLARGLDMIAEDAKMNVTVDTGVLRDSIKTHMKMEGSLVVGEVAAHAEHAVFEEMGTGEPGAASTPAGALIPVTYRTGGWVYPVKGGGFRFTRGRAARPYMLPAYKANKEAVIQSVADSIKKGVSG